MKPLSIEDMPTRQLTARSTGEILSLATSLTAPFALDRLLVFQERLAPGHRASRPHLHSRKEEMIVVLSGTATVLLGKERLQLGPGEVMGFPPASKQPHTITNETDIDVVFISIATNDPDDIVTYVRENTNSLL